MARLPICASRKREKILTLPPAFDRVPPGGVEANCRAVMRGPRLDFTPGLINLPAEHWACC
jgi:hypothetical protein